VATREDKIKAIVDDIMEKLPEPFNMSEIMGKVEERTPYVVVAFQVRIPPSFFPQNRFYVPPFLPKTFSPDFHPQVFDKVPAKKQI
jgi:hypothetical protein